MILYEKSVTAKRSVGFKDGLILFFCILIPNIKVYVFIKRSFMEGDTF